MSKSHISKIQELIEKKKQAQSRNAVPEKAEEPYVLRTAADVNTLANVSKGFEAFTRALESEAVMDILISINKKLEMLDDMNRKLDIIIQQGGNSRKKAGDSDRGEEQGEYNDDDMDDYSRPLDAGSEYDVEDDYDPIDS
ncbi:hypothetical protein EC988_000002 [Linderina pennispora]|nr:hypothetical protein EC988_000002 [Linderina pennispora]